MQITNHQRALHYAAEREMLRDYFPWADPGAIHEYVTALRDFDHCPTTHALDRLAIAYREITSSIPTIEIEP